MAPPLASHLHRLALTPLLSDSPPDHAAVSSAVIAGADLRGATLIDTETNRHNVQKPLKALKINPPNKNTCK